MRRERLTIAQRSQRRQITPVSMRRARSMGAVGFGAHEWEWLITGVWPDAPVCSVPARTLRR